MKFYVVRRPEAEQKDAIVTSKDDAVAACFEVFGKIEELEVEPTKPQVLAWLARIAELEARVAELEAEE